MVLAIFIPSLGGIKWDYLPEQVLAANRGATSRFSVGEWLGAVTSVRFRFGLLYFCTSRGLFGVHGE